MTDDCIHHIALCTECGGLEAVRLDRLPGVTAAKMTMGDGSSFRMTGDVKVYIGPAFGPCPTNQPEEITDARD